jgi:hypothetical protein
LGYTCHAAAATAYGTLGCPRWGFPR